MAKKYDISQADVKHSLSEFHNFISFVDLTEDNVASQLESDWKDFEDDIQHHCAIEDFSDVIVTRNEKDYSKSLIPVLNPKSLLDKFNEDVKVDE